MKLRHCAPSLGLLLPLVIAACSSDTASTTGGSGGAGGETSTATTGATTGATSSATTGATSSGTTGSGGAACGPDVALPDENLGPGIDPEGGDFTLEEALSGLPDGPGPLRVLMTTEQGDLSCELFPESAPIGVANFVGLVRGRRPWKDPVTKDWVKRPYYNGLIFHRVIDDFVIQGGDPLGNGLGGPGYKFADEFAGLHHESGTLAYANSGKNTNGSQFYITDGDQGFLDPNYVVFGLCEPLEVVQAIAAVETVNEKPVVDVHTLTMTITRCAP